jgi:hypothetical protein
MASNGVNRRMQNIDFRNKDAITMFSSLEVLLAHSHSHSLMQPDQQKRSKSNDKKGKRKKLPSS